MSTPSAGSEFLVLLVVALAVVRVQLGDHISRIDGSTRDRRVERVIHHITGVDPKAQQPWHTYARCVQAFSAVGVLSLFFLELLHGKPPLYLHTYGRHRRRHRRWRGTWYNRSPGGATCRLHWKHFVVALIRQGTWV